MWFFDEQEKLLMKIKRSSNQLYKLLIEFMESECLMMKLDDVSRLWHARLGHVNYQALSLMFKKKMVRGLP